MTRMTTHRPRWAIALATVLLCNLVSRAAAQLPPQEEDVVDESDDNNDANGPGPEEPSCSLCLDGSDPIGSDAPLENIFDMSSSMTCNELISMANAPFDTPDDCERLQLAAFQGGCCARSSFFDTPESFDRCRLCPGGEGPGFLAFKEIPFIAGSVPDAATATCSDLRQNTDVIVDLLQEYVQDLGECDDSVLRRTAGWCECMGASVECSLTCEGGAPVDMSAVHPLTGATCQEIEYQIALLDTAECPDRNLYLEFDPTALCCPSTNGESGSSCSLCTEQQGLQSSKTIDTDAYGAVTCADAQAAADLVFTDETCTDLQSQFSSECCLDTPEEESIETCALTCPITGEGPPDLLLQDPETGYSCSFLVDEYAKYTLNQCANATDILGFDAVSFCCAASNENESKPPVEMEETTPAPAPTDNEASNIFECRVCPKEKELAFPTRILFAYEERTCSEIETTASSITTEADCWDLLDRSRALSSCACRTVTSGEETGAGDEGAGGSNGSNGTSGGSRLTLRWEQGLAWMMLMSLL